MLRSKSRTIAVTLAAFLFAGMMPGNIASLAGAVQNDLPAPQSAMLYDFTNITETMALPEGLVKQTCSNYSASNASNSGKKTIPPSQEEAAQLAKGVADELTKQLAKKMPVTVAKPGDIPPDRSLVITGCFVSADHGNAAARLIGLGLGASHLSAHVRIFYADASSPKLIDEFDITVKGSSKLPPAGPVGIGINAARETQETLQADARKLADNILKRWRNDQEGGKLKQKK